jgi:hypothetical protein
MAQLILIVMAIALMSAFIAALVPNISADAVMRQSIQKETDYGLHLLEFGVIRYLDAHRDTNGNIIYPGNGVDLKPALSPMYAFIPANVRTELTWSVITGTVQGQPGVAICAYPVTTSNAPQKSALQNIQRTLPVGSAYLGDACNATSDSPTGVALSYWVVVSHVN